MLRIRGDSDALVDHMKEYIYYDILERIKDEYKKLDIYVTKEAIDSWHIDWEQGVIISRSPAAFHVEYGRLPNQRPPPIGEIKKWCRVKGIPMNKAYVIAKSIGKHGIRPREVVRKVLRGFPVTMEVQMG